MTSCFIWFFIWIMNELLGYGHPTMTGPWPSTELRAKAWALATLASCRWESTIFWAQKMAARGDLLELQKFGKVWFMTPIFYKICGILVGGFSLPLWKMMEFVSWDYDIPKIWKKCSKPPTSFWIWANLGLQMSDWPAKMIAAFMENDDSPICGHQYYPICKQTHGSCQQLVCQESRQQNWPFIS